MAQIIHILNGDALKNQVSDWLKGELIVARECLVDGDDYGYDIESFYQCRAKFISTSYEGYTANDYHNKTVPELEKIRNLSPDTEAHLWFEDDVFCQVNFWFCIHLLHQNDVTNLWLVRPNTHTQYGFGGLDSEQLNNVLEQRTQLKDQAKIAELWNCFKAKDINKMTALAEQLKPDYPFITEAVTAWIESLPSDKTLGKPAELLLQIMKDLNTQDFAPIFKEFCKRAPIYGYGDLQVKRLLDKL